MPQVLQEFALPIAAADGSQFTVVAWGNERPGGTWEGWLEFRPLTGGASLRTGTETTQSKLPDLMYWASGLETVYLEGALARAAP